MTVFAALLPCPLMLEETSKEETKYRTAVLLPKLGTLTDKDRQWATQLGYPAGQIVELGAAMIGVQPLLGGKRSVSTSDLSKLPHLRQWHWTYQQGQPSEEKQRPPSGGFEHPEAFQELKVN
ncbi:unnamed protein product [Penicillium bialowiezense]